MSQATYIRSIVMLCGTIVNGWTIHNQRSKSVRESSIVRSGREVR